MYSQAVTCPKQHGRESLSSSKLLSALQAVHALLFKAKNEHVFAFEHARDVGHMLVTVICFLMFICFLGGCFCMESIDLALEHIWNMRGAF